jgi:hypothetical protein
MLGAKLLRRRSVANETETATTGRAAHLIFVRLDFALSSRINRSSSFGHPAVRESYLWDLFGATVGFENSSKVSNKPYSLALVT